MVFLTQLIKLTSSVCTWFFIQEFNTALAHFRGSWNRHPLSTELEHISKKQLHYFLHFFTMQGCYFSFTVFNGCGH